MKILFMFKKKNNTIALLAFATAYIIWGANTPFIKVAVEQIHPTIYMVIRYAVPIIVLLPFALRGWKKLSSSTWLRLITSTVIGFTLTMVLVTEGIKRTSSTDASIIYLLAPVGIYFLSIKVLKEKFNAKILFGLLITLMGALLVVISPALGIEASEKSSLFGNILVFLSVVASVIGTIMVKPVMKKGSPVQITTLRFIISLIAILPLAYLNIDTVATIEWSASLIGVLAFSCIFASVIGFTLYHYGLSKISGEESSIMHYLDPIAGVFAAIIILGEQPTTAVIVGGGIALWGVVLAETKSKHRLHFLHAHK